MALPINHRILTWARERNGLSVEDLAEKLKRSPDEITMWDPFVIAAAKVCAGYAVTQESLKLGGARIPTVCDEFGVKCIDLEKFLECENLKY